MTYDRLFVHIFPLASCTVHIEREAAVGCLKMCLLSYNDVISLSAIIYHRLGGKGE